VVGGYSRTLGTVNGQPAVIDQQVIQRQTNRQLSVMLQYPFSRAQRAEFQAGVRNIGFSGEVRQLAWDPTTGQVIQEGESDLNAPPSITMGEVSTALVYDNSIFGGTGPVMGQRWRLEATPTFGNLNFVAALGDYRRYVSLARPVTLAGRLLHYGRYGRDADDTRMTPLFLGYQGLVRGYDNGSFTNDECVQAGNDPCPAFNQLLGSKVLVGNAELRVSLLGPLGLALRGFLPVDMLVFADGGVAWREGESPAVFGGARPAVGSVGTGLRFNLLGFAIAELDLVKPLDRPGKGWYLQFGLTPGF
jgi:hypothetical protein